MWARGPWPRQTGNMIEGSVRTGIQTLGFILSAEAAGPVADSVYGMRIKRKP